MSGVYQCVTIRTLQDGFHPDWCVSLLHLACQLGKLSAMMPPITPPNIHVTVDNGLTARQKCQFYDRFRIGRHSDCELQFKDKIVSRYHAEVFWENGHWWVSDLNSGNGVFVNHQRIAEPSPLMNGSMIKLGESGPVLTIHLGSAPVDVTLEVDPFQEKTLTIEEAAAESTPGKGPGDTIRDINQVKSHYFGKGDGGQVGEHTMMVRQAFAEVQKKQHTLYFGAIGLILVLLIVTGAVALYKHNQVIKQRDLAADIFYSLRTLEIELVKLNAEAEKRHSQEDRVQMVAAKEKKRELEASYRKYVSNLDVYTKGLSEEERLILRMANIFGECEINMPENFVKEVKKYIERWQSGTRFESMVRKAQRRNYVADIVEAMVANDLPPQFFYLALQESNFNPRAVGPPTRFGIAKGMWQFIPKTARQYGLKVGPLETESTVDLLDERHSFTKSTLAAADYLRDIYTTDAQASGLLVMASYNWGEHRIIELIQSMPANPRERNFWALISRYRNKIPDETYDYALSIFAAAVIGENPRLFGYDFDNPLMIQSGTRSG